MTKDNLTFSEACIYVMPFGKHKGVALRGLPIDYLLYLAWQFEKGNIGKMAAALLKFQGIDPDERRKL